MDNFFSSQSKRQQLREKEYLRALEKLQEVMIPGRVPKEFELEVVIQRFKFTYELAWKVLQGRLKDSGVINVGTPKDAFREAFSAGWIEGVEDWYALIKDRNFTSHVYHEEMARSIVKAVKDKHFNTLKSLGDHLCQ